MMLPEKKQVLVVDDEANLRRILAAMLQREGHDVHLAENGESALQILREHHIDLVITDLKMPRMDGMELLREALHRHLVRLASEVDANRWENLPHTEEELSLALVADWGPADDWADWADAPR